MEIKKVNLDRKNLSSSYIERKQDFNHVLKSAKMTKMPMWNSPWFYGAIGLSSVAIVTMVLTDNKFKNETNDRTATLKEKSRALAVVKETKKTDAVDNRSKDQIVYSISTINNSPVRLAILNESTADNSFDASLKQEGVEKEEEIETPSTIPSEEKKNSKLPIIGQPTIAGIASGKISVENLRNTDLIESNSRVRITSYEIQYYNGFNDITTLVRGDLLSTSMKEQIIQNNMNEMIFITGIKGVDEDGKIRALPSINLMISK